MKEKGPAPRSERMIDRLKLSEITLGKGKLFGPEDYFSFLLFTIIIYSVIFSKRYYESNFEDLQKSNIYNSLKDYSEDKADLKYKETQLTPQEKRITETNDYVIYKNKQIEAKAELNSKYSQMIEGGISEVPKFDIKKAFNKEI